MVALAIGNLMILVARQQICKLRSGWNGHRLGLRHWHTTGESS
jgi:hypothetical protein